MVCKNCGARIKEGKNFCPYCGEKIIHESISEEDNENIFKTFHRKVKNNISALYRRYGKIWASIWLVAACLLAPVIVLIVLSNILHSSGAIVITAVFIMAEGGYIAYIVGHGRWRYVIAAVGIIALVMGVGCFNIVMSYNKNYYINNVKNQVWEDYSDGEYITVGEAFDVFMDNPEWSCESRKIDGEKAYIVTVTGKAYYNDLKQTIKLSIIQYEEDSYQSFYSTTINHKTYIRGEDTSATTYIAEVFTAAYDAAIAVKE